jgi:hypothetical protein
MPVFTAEACATLHLKKRGILMIGSFFPPGNAV